MRVYDASSESLFISRPIIQRARVASMELTRARASRLVICGWSSNYLRQLRGDGYIVVVVRVFSLCTFATRVVDRFDD